MRFEHGALVLRVELSANVPLEFWYLNNLNEIRLRVASYTLHTVLLVLLNILVVELITMAVTLLDVLGIVDCLCATALTEYTLVCTETHCTTHV